MNAMALLCWVCAFSNIAWGALRFFRRESSGLTVHARAIAALGLVFGLWHLLAVVTSTAGFIPHGTAIVLLLASTLLFWSAVRAFKSGEPPTAIDAKDKPTRIMRDGPYRYVRHPFYASYTLFWLAGGVCTASIPVTISAAIMLVIYVRAARNEERKFAASPLAGDYEEYRRRTGLMVPRLHLAGARCLAAARLAKERY